MRHRSGHCEERNDEAISIWRCNLIANRFGYLPAAARGIFYLSADFAVNPLYFCGQFGVG
jgi:hypothetical protein